MHLVASEPLAQAAEALLAGRLVIYPTETLYALGCMATKHESVLRVVRAKNRPAFKPLPLIVGDWEMAERFLYLDHDTEELVRAFWPAPLSIIVKVCKEISPLAQDAQGRSAVRMTPHPVARSLCSDVGVPLISSSANRSGMESCSELQLLDSQLLQASGAVVVNTPPWPAGGLPSTLVEVVGHRTVRLLRCGSVGQDEIVLKGYEFC